MFEHAPRVQLHDEDALTKLRQQGYATFSSPFSSDEIAEARAFVLARYAETKRAIAARAPAIEGRPTQWEADGVTYDVNVADGRTRMHFSTAALENRNLPRAIREVPSLGALRSMASAYFDSENVIAGLPYYMAEVMEPGTRLEPWHIDCLRKTIKFSLSLDEIGPESRRRFAISLVRNSSTRLRHRLNLAARYATVDWETPTLIGGTVNASIVRAFRSRRPPTASSSSTTAESTLARG